MTAPSAYTSSFSDLGRSDASTPSSECALSCLYLLSPRFIDPARLGAFVSRLESGYGDKMVLLVAHAATSEENDIKTAMIRLGEAVPDACTANEKWVKILQDDAFYLVNGAPGTFGESSSMDKFTESHTTEVVLTTPTEALAIFSSTGLRVVFSISVPLNGLDVILPSPPTVGGGRATLYLLERPQICFPPLPCLPRGVPAREEWRVLWTVWDLVTMGMIPEEMLHEKPIELRHKCLFYIGHIPTFLDMLMSKALKEPNTEPKAFVTIFERGIDPHMDNPEQCHQRHSEVPDKDDDWPTLGSILAFRDRVRARVMQLYDDVDAGRRTLDRHVARMLVMTHEHEAWHVETLLYMLIQRAGSGTLPPPGFTPPPWCALAAAWRAAALPPTPTVRLGPAMLTLGHDDCEGDDHIPELAHDVATHIFGWDNESPERVAKVGEVELSWRPVTNAEYLGFYNTSGVAMPKSWVVSEQGVQVRTLYGPVSMDVAGQWPVLTSYEGLLAYARSVGGRLPTEPELRLFLNMYDVGHAGGANVGFRHWHPVPATTGLDAHAGKGTNGGIWEWTSTPLTTHPGMFSTAHFPGYTTDFVDGRHHVVLGASYATVPRLAERRTVRNFYQKGYAYAWIGARVVWDV